MQLKRYGLYVWNRLLPREFSSLSYLGFWRSTNHGLLYDTMTLPSDLSYPLLWFVAPLILGWPFGLLISDSILVTNLCTFVFTLWVQVQVLAD